jgi:hypothetical protein
MRRIQFWLANATSVTLLAIAQTRNFAPEGCRRYFDRLVLGWATSRRRRRSFATAVRAISRSGRSFG